MDRSWTRRRLLAGIAAASALTTLGGCDNLFEDIFDGCPTDPSQTGGVNWLPDIGHPVFFGYQDSGTTRIYYPTYSDIGLNAPLLRVCGVRWPVVLFLHGQPPLGIPFGGWNLRWELFGEVLARSGYVVVAPSHRASIPLTNYDAAVNDLIAWITYVRGAWSGADAVDQRASSTAVVGHSYGALLAARVCAARPDFGAFASLSGGFLELNDPDVAIRVGGQPSFFMWKDSAGGFEDLDHPVLNFWDLPQSKYAAVFNGEHFDYLPASVTGNADRGPCEHVGSIAADLVALFIASNLYSLTQVPIDLSKPDVKLTAAQEAFAGAHLTGEAAFRISPGCRLDLRWNVSGENGSRQID